jgi:hypothetical protein
MGRCIGRALVYIFFTFLIQLDFTLNYNNEVIVDIISTTPFEKIHTSRQEIFVSVSVYVKRPMAKPQTTILLLHLLYYLFNAGRCW